MKKKLLVLFCFLAFHSSVSAGEFPDINGYDWLGMSESEKMSFFAGWINGSKSGMKTMFSVALYRCGAIAGKTFNDSQYNLKEMSDAASQAGGFDLGAPLTAGQIIKTINKIYSDPRVKTWDIGKIMPFVRGRLVGGWTKKDLEEVIAYESKTKWWAKPLSEWPKALRDNAERARSLKGGKN